MSITAQKLAIRMISSAVIHTGIMIKAITLYLKLSRLAQKTSYQFYVKLPQIRLSLGLDAIACSRNLSLYSGAIEKLKGTAISMCYYQRTFTTLD